MRCSRISTVTPNTEDFTKNKCTNKCLQMLSSNVCVTRFNLETTKKTHEESRDHKLLNDTSFSLETTLCVSL